VRTRRASPVSLLRGVLDEAHEGLLALDEHGSIMEANLAAAAFLGHERRALMGKPFAALVSLDDRKKLRRRLAVLARESGQPLELRFLGRESTDHVTLRLLRSSPAVVAVSITSDAPPPAPRGNPRGRNRVDYFLLRFPHAVVALRNDRRVAFANARARTLLGRAAVRTGAVFGEGVSHELVAVAHRLADVPAAFGPTEIPLDDDRVLRVAGLPATASEPAVLLMEDVTDSSRQARLMQEFLRNAAHQLRTPLAGITAAVETLQAGAKHDPEQRDRFLDHVETHAERLSRRAPGPRTHARAEAGESVPIDFVELQPLLAGIASEASPRDGVEIRTVCPPGLAAIAAPDLLHETLVTLMDNAIAHTYAGEIRLAAVRSDGQVKVSVTDSGHGILPEFLDRVFEPFFRLSPSGDGYGLGLAIAAQAVRTMRGEIGVSSTPGAGTVFTVTLPSGG
jgi:PAS domain S-box-containing protein